MSQFVPELSPTDELVAHFGLTKQEAETRYDAVVAKGIPFLTSASQIPELLSDNRKPAIIGYGPTIRAEVSPGVTALDELNARNDLIKILVGSTHGSLDKFKGVSLAVIGLTDKNMLASYTNVSKDVTYLVAAQAAPEIFDQLQTAGANVLAYDACIPGITENAGSVAPGDTAATAALAVVSGILGKKDIELFGVDGSTTKKDGLTLPAYAFGDVLTDDLVKEALTHPVPYPLEGHTLVPTTAGSFEVSDNFMAQLKQFYEFNGANPDVTLHFHGNSAHAALCNKPVASVSPVPGLNKSLIP